MSAHSLEKRPNKYYNWIFFTISSILILRTLYIDIRSYQYTDWGGFCDYLYNYSGGFIRRGLTGEILFFLKDVLSIPPLVTCVVTSIIGYLILTFYVIYKFNEKGYYWGILLMGFMLGGILIFDLAAWRRDYIEMTLFLAIIYAFKKIRITKWLILSNCISTFGILLHEASFFFMVPVCIFLTNVRLHNMYKSAIVWLPATAAFLACCFYKGNAEMYNILIDTARTSCPEAFVNGEIPNILTFISRDTTDVIWLHIWLNFTQPFYGLPIPVGVITFFYFIYVPYITLAMLKTFSRTMTSNKSLGVLLSLIGFQFVCLLPMFTILSCDLCRVCFYWIMSSLLVWLTIDKREIRVMFIQQYNHLSNWITTKILSLRLSQNKVLLAFCVIFIGVTFYIRQPIPIISSSPAGVITKTVLLAVNKIIIILNI